MLHAYLDQEHTVGTIVLKKNPVLR